MKALPKEQLLGLTGVSASGGSPRPAGSPKIRRPSSLGLSLVPGPIAATEADAQQAPLKPSLLGRGKKAGKVAVSLLTPPPPPPLRGPWSAKDLVATSCSSTLWPFLQWHVLSLQQPKGLQMMSGEQLGSFTIACICTMSDCHILNDPWHAQIDEHSDYVDVCVCWTFAEHADKFREELKVRDHQHCRKTHMHELQRHATCVHATQKLRHMEILTMPCSPLTLFMIKLSAWVCMKPAA